MVSGQAEGTRRSRVMLYCCGFVIMRRPRDGGFAVADHDVLTGERLLGGQIAGPAVLIDAGVVVCGPRSQNVASGLDSRWWTTVSTEFAVATIAFRLPRLRARRR
jgi:hypothetical protein